MSTTWLLPLALATVPRWVQMMAWSSSSMVVLEEGEAMTAVMVASSMSVR
jgi:hypothetical protein